MNPCGSLVCYTPQIASRISSEQASVLLGPLPFCMAIPYFLHSDFYIVELYLYSLVPGFF